MRSEILRGLRAATDILLPRVCMVCNHKLLVHERYICLHCLADMPLTYFWNMTHNPMADKFNGVIQHGLEYDDLCSSVKEPYAYATALFLYQEEGDYKRIPYQIKYHSNTKAGKHFGQMLGKRLASSCWAADVDIVIPVPLHWSRRWKRGYNQAEIIAEGVAEVLQKPLRCDILKRNRKTSTQTILSVEDKTLNVAGAFTAICPEGYLYHKNQTEGLSEGSIRHILLLDDVFTTGSTVGECFRALRKVFPPSVRISVATLAFVGRA